ncbi:MAG: PDZ domain-containing protein [Thermogutta sp.]
MNVSLTLRRILWKTLLTAIFVSIICMNIPGVAVFGGTLAENPAAAEKATKKETKPDDGAKPEKHEKTEYWLGITCGPIPDFLRAHVAIPENEGILVHAVAKNSPAERAGICQHDILLAAANKVLKSPEDLVAVVNEKKDQSFEIKLLRKGKTETVTVTAEPRPAEAKEEAPPFPGPWAPTEAWEKWFEWFRKQLPNQPPLTFRFYRPGIVVPPGEGEDWPKDLTIVITKEGSQPAKIVVRRGDKTWEVTEKELDKLPKDIRPHVERMLRGSRGIPGGLVEVKPFGQLTPPKELEKDLVRPFRGWLSPDTERLERIEKRLEELNRRLDELQKKDKSE